MSVPGAVSPFWYPASLAAALDQSVVAPVFLVTVTCGKFEPVWTSVLGLFWQLTDRDEVQSITCNGVAMNLAASAVDVATTPNSWFWGSNRVLSIHLTADADPNLPAYIIETLLIYRFTDGATGADAGGKWWEPRLVDLPALGSRIPVDFKGVVQIGGGTLTMANEDDFFTTRLNQNWDAGTTEVKMGVAGLAYGDYVRLATFSNFVPSLDDQRFTLQVKESKADTEAEYPVTTYGTTEFPNMRPDDVGRAKQLAYGFVQDVNPVCIDQVGIEFQVANHAIQSFEAVRVFNTVTNTWDSVNFGSTDLIDAKFTLDSLTWQPGIQVAVDFYGRNNVDGTLMANPADVAADLLTLAGYTVDTTSNNVARDYLRMGATAGVPNDLACVALYIDTPQNILQLVEEVAFNCRCYFTSNSAGQFYFRPWRTYRASTVARVTDIDVLKPGLKRDIQPGINGFKATQILVNFSTRPSVGASSQVVASSPLSQYTRDKGGPASKTYESLCWKQRDALFLAQSLMAEEQFDSLVYSLKLKWRPFTWRPGEHLWFVSDVQSLDVLAEILEVRMNLTARSVDLKLGNLRGFNDATGFWSSDSDVCPNGASMTWAHDSQVNYRRKETGIWHNTKDQAIDASPVRTDWATSRWL